MKASGIVISLFPDDIIGSKHQKFTLKLANGKTVLVIHNIDISNKIGELKIGDKVSFLGEYQWNAFGGMVHWTHKDPHGNHPDGWLKYNGKIYQ